MKGPFFGDGPFFMKTLLREQPESKNLAVYPKPFHTGRMVDYLGAIGRAIDYVEHHLCDPFTVEDVSKAAFQSRWHFQRVFRLVTGLSLYKYIQKRRLAEAGSDLLLKKEKVIDLAFKYQYGSPEAFTRAFVKEYGQAPRAYKETLEHPIFPRFDLDQESFQPSFGQGDIQYRSVTRGELTLFGKTYRTSMQDQRNEKDVPLAWQDFFGKEMDQKIQKRENSANYGIYHDWDYQENFTILLGCPVSISDCSKEIPIQSFLGENHVSEPARFKLLTIKACKYMVFTVPGNRDEDILAGWNYIYGNYLPKKSVQRDYSVDFDVFDERFFSAEPVSEIYIPIL